MGLWCLCADPYTLLTLTPLPPFPPSQSYQAILLQTFVMLYLLHNTRGILALLPSNCLWVRIYGFETRYAGASQDGLSMMWQNEVTWPMCSTTVNLIFKQHCHQWDTAIPCCVTKGRSNHPQSTLALMDVNCYCLPCLLTTIQFLGQSWNWENIICAPLFVGKRWTNL